MKKRILPFGLILLFFFAAFGLGWYLVSSLGTVIAAAADAFGLDADTAETVRAIFSQLNDAVCVPHFWIPAGLAVLFALMRLLLPPKNGGAVFLYVLLGILLWLTALLSTVMLARINGIRILDIVKILINLIRGGLLEIL